MANYFTFVQDVAPRYVAVQPPLRPLVDRVYTDDDKSSGFPLAHNGISQALFDASGRVHRGVPLHRYGELFRQLAEEGRYKAANAAMGSGNLSQADVLRMTESNAR